MIEIIPTIVPASLADVGEVSKRYGSFTSFFQIDVADGVFAPNTTWLPSKGDVLPEAYGYEVHLMVNDPGAVGTLFAKAGARALIPHIETFSDIESAKRLFKEWRDTGVRSVGIAVLLRTPLDSIAPYLPLVDFVQLMTIASIGVQGIPYDTSAPARVGEFHKRYPEVLISVDGGVSASNIGELARAGASHFGVGSAISRAPDPGGAYQRLKSLAQGALT